MDGLEHSPGWKAANRAFWLLGTAVVAAHVVGMLIFGTGIRIEAEEAAQRQMIAEHGVICDEFDKGQGDAVRERCLTLLLQLQQRHEQAYMARAAASF